MITPTQREMIQRSTSYKLIKLTALWMDRRMLDPIVGALFPAVGDFLTPTFSLPFVYVSLIQVKSIPLTLAVLYNMLVDVLIGLIPFIGIVGDFFKRAFAKNVILIEGYVEGKQEVIRDVEKKAVWMALLILLLLFLIYLMFLLVGKIFAWVGTLF